jgi:bifunctional ADP-heptose synthase (sugar kinase/adenylyltransferase)
MIWKKIENSDKEIEVYAKEFVNKMNTNLVITRGAMWASIFTKEWKYYHIETVAKDVFDVTWAWDTFIATIAYALSYNFSLVDAVKLWNKASWVVVWKTWTEIILKDELFN